MNTQQQREAEAIRQEYEARMREALFQTDFNMEGLEDKFNTVSKVICTLMNNKCIADFTSSVKYTRFCNLKAPVKMYEMEIAISMIQRATPKDMEGTGIFAQTLGAWYDENVLPIVDMYNSMHKEIDEPIRRSIEARLRITQGVPDSKKIFK